MTWGDKKLRKAVKNWEHQLKLAKVSLGVSLDAYADLIEQSYKVAKLDNGESAYTKYALHTARTIEKLKNSLEKLYEDIFTQANKELEEMGGKNG